MHATTARRTHLLVIALVAVAFAGCFNVDDSPSDPAPGTGSPSPAPGTATAPDPTPGPARGGSGGLVLACPPPCARVIDAGPRFEPAIAIDPADPKHMVAGSLDVTQDPVTGERGWWPLAHVTFDGGATWETRRLPGGPSADREHPLFRYNAMGDPAIVILRDGTVLYSAIADARASYPVVPYTKTGDALVLLRSRDGGLTYPDVVEVKGGEGASSVADVLVDAQDKQWFAVGADGTILLAWVRIQEANAANPDIDESVSIVTSHSKDAGRTWSPLSTIVTASRLQGPFPIIRDDGALVVSYVDQRTSTVNIATSLDQGRKWSVAELDDVSTKFPVLAQGTGPTGERIYMAYPASSEGVDSKQTPKLRWSDDGGATWSAPVVLDVPDVKGPTIPALAVASDGTAYVTFWHGRGGDALLRAMAYRDGMFSDVSVLDTTQGAAADTGHYMGLVPLPDGGAYAVWAAYRGGEGAVKGARIGVS